MPTAGGARPSPGMPLSWLLIHVQDQRLLASAADPFSEAGSRYEFGSDFSILLLLHISSHDLSTPDINHQIEIEADPLNVGRQIADIPTPQLIWAIGPQPGNWSWLLGKPGSATALGLAMGMQYSVKTPL